MGRIYLVSGREEIARRRRALPGVLIEVWPDLHAGDLFWMGDDETRRAVYTSASAEGPSGGLFWIGETSKVALDGAGEPLGWDLAIDDVAVPIYYGPHVRDADSLPPDDSVRARVLSAHAIAALWATYDRWGTRVEHRPQSPLDPRFYLRRPGGKTAHLFRALSTRAEAVAVIAECAGDDVTAVAWAEALGARDFEDLVQRYAIAGR